METTTQKHWPMAEVVDGAVYVQSFQHGTSKYDLYVTRRDIGLLVGQSQSREIYVDGGYYFEENRLARKLLLDYFARQSPQPAPTRTRDVMIESITNLIGDATHACFKARATLIVDALHPELKPKPAPVEAVKTEGADTIFNANGRYTLVVKVGSSASVSYDFTSPCADACVAILRAVVGGALAARDAAHQTALAELRNRAIALAPWLEPSLPLTPSAE